MTTNSLPFIYKSFSLLKPHWNHSLLDMGYRLSKNCRCIVSKFSFFYIFNVRLSTDLNLDDRPWKILQADLETTPFPRFPNSLRRRLLPPTVALPQASPLSCCSVPCHAGNNTGCRQTDCRCSVSDQIGEALFRFNPFLFSHLNHGGLALHDPQCDCQHFSHHLFAQTK